MKIKTTPYKPKSKSQTHLTPDSIFELIEEIYHIPRHVFFDPCPAFTPYRSPIFFNGLYGKWRYFNYVNSPFEIKVLTQFVEKAVEQAELYGSITIMLCPVKTDQEWFQKYIIPRIKKVHWIDFRVKFKNDKWQAPEPHFLVMID